MGEAEVNLAVPALVERADGTIYYAYKDTPQANVYLGHLGVRPQGPDEPTVEIMNYILGYGGFSARLMRELRSDRGLTYGIYGGVSTGRDRGLFVISSQLKADRFVEALGIIKGIITDLQTTPAGDDEIGRPATRPSTASSSATNRRPRSSGR